MTTLTVPLTQGKVALLDEADWPLVSQHQWYAACMNGRWYAYRKIALPNGQRRMLGMHRLIVDAPDGVLVDHRDGDSLNNRRENLRLATRHQNRTNCGPRQGVQSGYKGVYFRKRQPSRPYEATLRLNGRLLYLGSYASAEEAARAYDTKARAVFGGFAGLNFPH